jgi:hypothetical protein
MLDRNIITLYAVVSAMIMSLDEGAKLIIIEPWCPSWTPTVSWSGHRPGAIIAAAAESHGCVVVTDDKRDFLGIECLNRMRAVPLC